MCRVCLPSEPPRGVSQETVRWPAGLPRFGGSVLPGLRDRERQVWIAVGPVVLDFRPAPAFPEAVGNVASTCVTPEPGKPRLQARSMLRLSSLLGADLRFEAADRASVCGDRVPEDLAQRTDGFWCRGHVFDSSTR